MKHLLLLVYLILYIPFIYAQDKLHLEARSLLNPRQEQQSWIYDKSKILTNSGKQDNLNRMISALEKDKGYEIMIAILPSIGDQNPKQFAVDLFENWKIGKAKEDNGLLVLHVLDQRRIEIETGYGLEGRLTDLICKRILDKQVVPYFKLGAYSTGYESLIRTLDTILRESKFDLKDLDSYSADLPLPKDAPKDKIPAIEPENRSDSMAKQIHFRNISYLLGGLSTILYILYPIFLFRFANRWKTKYYFESTRKEFFLLSYIFFFGAAGILMVVSVALFQSSFFGDDWLYLTILGSTAILTSITFLCYTKLRDLWEAILRDAKIICSQCSSLMERISNPDKYYANMTENEKVEKEIRAYRFDLYECKKCNHVDKFRYPGSDASHYEECKVCQCKSLVVERKTTKMATFSEAGVAEIHVSCKKCGFEEHNTVSIAVITEDKSSPESYGSTSSSYSDDSSSSNDSSSSSSGGSSGGGGAGADY